MPPLDNAMPPLDDRPFGAPAFDRAVDTVHKAIIFEDVSIGFEDLAVLDSVSFELKRGETKVIMGVAGSVTSTIL
jgi:ABC-type uncharacterized transport system ATPase subunit